jgi:hypothetical protein
LDEGRAKDVVWQDQAAMLAILFCLVIPIICVVIPIEPASAGEWRDLLFSAVRRTGCKRLQLSRLSY